MKTEWKSKTGKELLRDMERGYEYLRPKQGLPLPIYVQQIRKIAEITGFKVERTVDSLHHFRVTTDYGILIFHFCDTLEDAEKLAHIIVEKRDDFEGICFKMEKQLGYCK